MALQYMSLDWRLRLRDADCRCEPATVLRSPGNATIRETPTNELDARRFAWRDQLAQSWCVPRG